MTSDRTPRSTSGIPLRPFYVRDDIDPEFQAALEFGPGEPPYLRGAYPRMYADRLWRIFQLSGYGDPGDMNARLKFLLRAGETGIIIKHDRMTDDHLYDVDHPEIVERREDVGLTGTVTVGLRDYETILDGLPIESIYAKPGGGVPQAAPYTQACYWSVAERRGIPLDRLSGTGQSDFFLTYIGCPTKEQIPPAAAMRLNIDIIEWCAAKMPRWVPVSIAGYNGADSGLNAYQELGAVLANAIEYFDRVVARGNLRPDQVVDRLSGVNFRTSMDLFEDVAKLRVARKMWSDIVSERYGVRGSKGLRIHVVTAGSAMTYQEPFNNIIRGTLMALAAALGGAQSLGVSGYDEAMSIPSDHAHLMSIRTQQILQHEVGLADVADPLGGSFYLETLCRDLEERARGFMGEIAEEGGFLATIDSGWLMDKAYEGQLAESSAIESGERKIIGVNSFQADDPLLAVSGFEGRSGSATWERAMERLEVLRKTRDPKRVARAMGRLEQACRSTENIVPPVMAAVQSDVSIGEIGAVFRSAFGDWTPPIAI